MNESSTQQAVAFLVSNWTNPDFAKFVQDLDDVVNLYVLLSASLSSILINVDGVYRLGIEEGSEAWVRAEQIWSRVVELEEAFWPVGGEELGALPVDADV